MAKEKSVAEKNELSVEEKLRALYNLQQVDSKIDKIRTVRGELPLEVADLEDELAGLETRFQNIKAEVDALEESINDKKNLIKDSLTAIKKYETQQDKVRNNREFESLSKEIEFQNLEIQLAEKRIKEYKAAIITKSELVTETEANIEERRKDLTIKKKDLEEIIAETQKEEEDLIAQSQAAEKKIEARLVNAYKRIRSNSRNGLAVVTVERDSCGGCFNKIPPQTQLDIRTHKKIIVCEHCGRVLVDAGHLHG
jgi:predicted  nucleic acid-binding Zn-ribbon protein